MKRFSIAIRSCILIVVVAIVAIVAMLGCTRAGSSRTHARSLKPTPAMKSHVGVTPAETRPLASEFLPIEAW